ncbi:hypothetical protein [Arcanobacterium bovis]|uniref:Uncharacterized protein n=1 Tax=Arcanobacterium bovis TaxID=2529275 RepID=A0A4Q9UYT7_9ACTO|nr:hypothetical protein [Arcanobacterium bovis]TBW20870.1 hypothetical protein EZJ44_08050 [Arcanobacterium bovis]
MNTHKKMAICKVRTVSLILLACLGLCSCSGSVEEKSIPSTELDIKADIDKEHYSITLPSDRYANIQMLSSDEIILQSAESAVIAECARNKLNIPIMGVPTWRLSDGQPFAFTEFGPWNVKIAEKYGFSNPSMFNALIPETRIKIPAGETDPLEHNSQFTEQQRQTVNDQCAKEETLNHFNTRKLAPHGPWTEELNNTRSQLLKDKRAQNIIRELDQCFVQAGLKMSSEVPGYVEGVIPDEITPRNLTMAVKAAQCQEKLNATPRLVEIWADLQAPIITKYADELIAQRQKIDKAVADAKEYINAHPELFKPPK